MTELERAIRYRDECWAGTTDASNHGPAIMWLMGWADWAAEVEILQEAAE